MQTTKPSLSCLAVYSLDERELARARSALQAEHDWQNWLNLVELHGLSGFVNKHLSEHDLPIPAELHLPLRALKVRHTAAAAARRKVLGEIDAAFAKHGIQYLALKGAALAPYLYKDAALRPMRDMDLLLPLEQLTLAATVMREIGFDLPEEQPSKFMRDMHQLPNATKSVDGFLCSVELHRDGISRDINGHCYYPQNSQHIQIIDWEGLKFQALDDVQMLFQVCRHLEGVQTDVLKLINVMDVVLLASRVLKVGRWPELVSTHPQVLNTLYCLHCLTPLPDDLQNALDNLPQSTPDGVGGAMGSLRSSLLGKKGIKAKFKPLFSPSDWWLHLYYNVHPDSSLRWVKLVRHPLRVGNWLARRLYSRLLGG